MARLLIIYWMILWTSFLQVAVSKPSSDPVASVCSPLCKEDTTLETYCGSLLGCSDLDVNNDRDLFLVCWTPCLDLAEKCFTLCVDKFDEILQTCYNDCRTMKDPVNCIAFCFDASFLQLKQGFLTNSTNISSSDVITQQTTTETSLTPVISQSLSTLKSEVLDSPWMNENLIKDIRFSPTIATNTGQPDLKITMEVARSNTNNTTKVGRADNSKTIHVDTSISNNTFRIDISKTKNSKTAQQLEEFLTSLFSAIISKEWPTLNTISEPDRTKKVVKIISYILKKDVGEIQLPIEEASTTSSIQSSTDPIFHRFNLPSIQSSINESRKIKPLYIPSFLKPKYISRKPNETLS